MSEVRHSAIERSLNWQGRLKIILKNNMHETQLAYWGRKLIVASGLNDTIDKLPTSNEMYSKLFGPELGT
jgi:hypothetical protein